eukprot:gnl/Spiro4/21752_TR10658_c0_g1_i1.p1 gnl/Spiro4/21752_TR10658_c0_g1~~gnl/Spiro4/21752_TR10658_c0_g1_i1.p1  ORF type:complete len:140 (+),score=25.25 gnl/Spiro4/21752_TR10658_c0_g1_i1:101-520(+)
MNAAALSFVDFCRAFQVPPEDEAMLAHKVYLDLVVRRGHARHEDIRLVPILHTNPDRRSFALTFGTSDFLLPWSAVVPLCFVSISGLIDTARAAHHPDFPVHRPLWTPVMAVVEASCDVVYMRIDKDILTAVAPLPSLD